MSIIRVSKTPNQFSIIDRTPAEDPRLSFKAKGIMFYLLTKPDDWTIRVTDLMNRSADGRDAIYSGIKELERTGYIERKSVQGIDGKFEGYEYTVYENPINLPLTENPDTVENRKKRPLTENPDTVKPDTENTYISNNNLNDNKEEEEEGIWDRLCLQIFGNKKVSPTEGWFIQFIIDNNIPLRVAKKISNEINLSEVDKHVFFKVIDTGMDRLKKGRVKHLANWIVGALENEQLISELEEVI